MKRSLIFIALVIVCSTGVVLAGGGDQYGAGVTLEKAVPIDGLLANPGDFIGQKVRVDGTITGMCQKRGCWMQVSNEQGDSVRIKVEDGVIVFPATSMGHKASAEGIFEGVPVAAQVKKHEGEDEEDDKHKACDAEPQDEMIYFIQGTGAVIYS